MSSQQPDRFEEIIRNAGESWLIDSFASRDQALSHLRKRLTEVQACAASRGGSAPASRIDEHVLIATYTTNRERVRAFLQALGTVSTPEMLLMVWRIQEGWAIASASMEYVQEQNFQLCVQLAWPDRNLGPEDYKSNDIDDAALLRHLGILKIDDKPVLDGFYALSLQKH
ncbi:MAG TPA: hypothetical protein P5572_19035 [Phycisphaerae bacterium]|nr:hypothetical protein [Phycisphaerales bacterium]HRX87126.1 hypothetical protein [Phycisphaerae bacterium]